MDHGPKVVGQTIGTVGRSDWFLVVGSSVWHLELSTGYVWRWRSWVSTLGYVGVSVTGYEWSLLTKDPWVDTHVRGCLSCVHGCVCRIYRVVGYICSRRPSWRPNPLPRVETLTWKFSLFLFTSNVVSNDMESRDRIRFPLSLRVVFYV